MARTFEVAVLGGGIMGATLAGALAELDLSTVLIERGTVGGQGATRYSGGIVRLFDPDDAVAELAIASLARTTDTRVGAAFAESWTRSGVYYATEMPSIQPARAFASFCSAHNYPIRVLSRREAALEYPCVRAGDDGFVIMEESGGYADVRASSRAAIAQLRRSGVVLENACPLALRESDDEIEIEFAAGTIAARALVVAPGSWANVFYRNLPLRIRSIPMVHMETAGSVPRAPLIDITAASYFVPTGAGSIAVGSRVRSEATSPELLAFDQSAIVEDARSRLNLMTGNPEFGEPISVVRGHDGYIADGRPVVGQIPNRPSFVALGFAGIGYKLALGAAWALARHIVSHLRSTQVPDSDSQLLSPFSPARLGASAWVLSPELTQ